MSDQLSVLSSPSISSLFLTTTSSIIFILHRSSSHQAKMDQSPPMREITDEEKQQIRNALVQYLRYLEIMGHLGPEPTTLSSFHESFSGMSDLTLQSSPEPTNNIVGRVPFAPLSSSITNHSVFTKHVDAKVQPKA